MNTIRISDLLHTYRGIGAQSTCPPGMSLFGNPPTCVTNDIAGQAAANAQAASGGGCPPGFQLEGTGPQFCSPMGAGGGSPCDYGNTYIAGSCYPNGSSQSGNVITLPDGTQIDASTGMVIGSYDWIVSHGGGSSVSTGPSPQTQTNQSGSGAGGTLSFSINGSSVVGASWSMGITGAAANQPVYITATKNGVSLGKTQFGSTDGNGNWGLQGSFDQSTVGSWVETVYVGGNASGTLTFTVAQPQSGSTQNQTGGSSQTNSTNKTLLPPTGDTTQTTNWVDSLGDVTLFGTSVPVLYLVVGGVVVVGAVYMMTKKGRG